MGDGVRWCRLMRLVSLGGVWCTGHLPHWVRACVLADSTPITRCQLRDTLNIASDLHKRRDGTFSAWVMVLSHYGGLGRSRPLPGPYRGYRLSIHAHCAAIPYVFRSGLVDGSTFPFSDHSTSTRSVLGSLDVAPLDVD